jgi:hypothetical protein
LVVDVVDWLLVMVLGTGGVVVVVVVLSLPEP